MPKVAVLKTLVSFGGSLGAGPDGNLIENAAGDLLGTTNSDVFEVAATAGGYATTATTVAESFGGDGPGLTSDATGDLFGYSVAGGANKEGSVFEVAESGGAYANVQTTLASFSGADGEFPSVGPVLVDAEGDLLGETLSGGSSVGDGTVFEIAKTASGYASAVTTLVDFDGAAGRAPTGGLTTDAAGDLFGVTMSGGADGYGTVFEIAKTADGYASAATVLASLPDGDGRYGVEGPLIADANGDLFGVTGGGGVSGDGSVFELVKTAGGYDSTITTLASFDGADGNDPQGSLVIDGNGDLFGTTLEGGANDDGVVFEIAKTAGGYESVPDLLVSFDFANGYSPGSLLIDSSGRLFGTTYGGGASDAGTVFEITFVPAPTITGALPDQSVAEGATIDPFAGVTIADPNADQTETVTITPSAAADGALFDPNSASDGSSLSSGVYTVTGTALEVTADIEGLRFTPAAGLVAPWQYVPDSFAITVADTAGATASDDATSVATTAAGATVTLTASHSYQLISSAQTDDPFAGVAIRDVNTPAPTELLTVTLSDPSNGTLSNLDGGGYDAATGVYTDSGSVAEVTAALDGLVFTPTMAPNNVETTTFTIEVNDGVAPPVIDASTSVVASSVYQAAPTPVIGFSFTQSEVVQSGSRLTSFVVDAEGDLIGSVQAMSLETQPMVFELAKTQSGYAASPTTLATFSEGVDPAINLAIDVDGDIFGTTSDDDIVFMIAKTSAGYTGGPVTLATLGKSLGTNAYNTAGGIVVDAAGDLFLTTNSGGATGFGALSELVKTGSGYASAPILLDNFSSAGSASEFAGLTPDANGDFFGVTETGGGDGDGAVFEIARTSGVYAAAPVTLASFDGSDGAAPVGALVADAQGDLFGATSGGGANGDGTIFEIVETAGGYASAPTTLVAFDGADGAAPIGNLTMDASGDLFGVTTEGGEYGDGVAFEIAKTPTGYAAVPTTVRSFEAAIADPQIVNFDEAGDGFTLTSQQYTTGEGRYQVNSGSSSLNEIEYSPIYPAPAISRTVAGQDIVDKQTDDPFAGVTISDADSAASVQLLTVNLSNPADGTLSNLGGGTYDAATGVYSDTGSSAAVSAAIDGLVFTPTIAPGASETTTFTISVDDGHVPAVTDATTTVTVSSTMGGDQILALGGAPGHAASLYDTAGDWDSVSGSDGLVFLTTAQASVFGGDDTIEFAAGTDEAVSLYGTNGQWDSIDGSHDARSSTIAGTIYLTDAQASIFSGGQSISLFGSSDDQVSLYDTGGDWDSVVGSYATLYLTDAQASVFGSYNSIYLLGNLDDQVSIYGDGDDWQLVYGSNSTIYLTSAFAFVDGGDDLIVFAGGSAPAVEITDTNGDWDNVNGSRGKIDSTLAGTVYLYQAQASVFSGGELVRFLGTAADDAASLYDTGGVWDTVSGVGGTVYLTNAQASVFDGAQTVNFAGGSGNAVSLYSTDNSWDVVAGSGGAVYLTSSQASVFGSLDTIDFSGGTGDAASLYGTNGVWDTLEGSNGTVYLTSAQSNVIGAGDAIIMAGTGAVASLAGTSGEADHVNGTNAAVYLYGAQATMTGSSDTLHLYGSSSLTLVGGSDLIVFNSGVGGLDTIAGFASSDQIELSKTDFANFNALSKHLTQSGANAVITLNPSDAITLTGVQASSLTASQFSFV